MRLVIKNYFHDRRTGELIYQGTCDSKSSWESVDIMQRQRLAHYRDHPQEDAVAIPGGFICWERDCGAYGYRTVQCVTLEA